MARLLHMLLEELTLNLKRAEGHARLTLRWRGGTVTTLEVPVPAFPAYGARTDEDTISLLLPASRPYETANSGQNVNIVSST